MRSSPVAVMPADTTSDSHSERLIVAPDEDAGAGMLMEHLSEAMRSGSSSQLFSVIIPGGRGPRLFFSKAVQSVKTKPAQWKRIHFLFSDERCVAPEDPQSNFRQASDLLFKPAGIADCNVHRIRGEDIPSEAAAAYAADITCTLGPNPKPDFTILGLGDDGHTASLFPGTELHVQNHDVAGWCHVPKLNSWRVTLTAEFLRRSGTIYVIAWGEGKAEAVKKALSGKSTSRELPVLGLRPHRGRLTWLLDEGAASLL